MILNKRIKDILHYIGLIGSGLMCIAYLLIVVVLVQGFNTAVQWQSTLLFAAVNAVIGLIIMELLKVQGVAFAKAIPANEEILTRYFSRRTKARKLHSIKWYWWTSILKDVAIKGLSLAATTFGFVYIAIQGSHDYHLLLMAVVNLVMFICFGLLALNSAYDYFNNEYIPYLLRELDNASKEALSDPEVEESNSRESAAEVEGKGEHE